jgi:hypothetical protein
MRDRNQEHQKHQKSIRMIKNYPASVALQGVSGSTATVFIRWPYSPKTFDRVLRIVRLNY